MYGEPSRIREIATRLEQRAEALRVQATELLSRSDSVEWRSVAADRMRAAARDRHDELVRVAGDYEEAARRVREHADRVEELLDLIASIERQARAIIASALDRVRDAAKAVLDGIKDALDPGDEDDRRIAATETPPPGHKDWLDVPDLLPGIRL
ncbi:MAG: hypothetical protein LT071_07585 [Nocardioides sp.]|nr:hypothetical protein [Nocardioides sp.]